MDKGKFLSGLAVMAGLIVMGLMIPRAVEKYRSYDRVVNVKGLCEKEVKADRVIWPIVYKVMANDIQSIYDQTAASNAAVVSFLDSGSKLGKIKTASQGTFSIENRDSNTPYIKKVRVVTSVTYYLKN